MIDMVDSLPDLMLKNVGYELKDTFAFHGFFFNPLVGKPFVILIKVLACMISRWYQVTKYTMYTFPFFNWRCFLKALGEIP